MKDQVKHHRQDIELSKDNAEIQMPKIIRPRIDSGSTVAKRLIMESSHKRKPKGKNPNPNGHLSLIKEGLEEDIFEVNGVTFDSETDHSDRFGWVQDGENISLTVKPTMDTLNSEYYVIETTYNGWYLRKKHLFLDELYKLPNDATARVVEDIQKFWNSKDRYAEYGITYKRGYLMYGVPGTGKSSMINLLAHKIVHEHNGLVFDYHSSIVEIIRQIRLIEKDKLIMIIMEELETLISYEGGRILNLLDGNDNLSNVVFVGCTNYITQLPPRIVNRPSRFDMVFEYPLPDRETREFFFRKKLKEDDLASVDLSKWVNDTDNLSLSHLKELVASVIVMGQDYEQTIAKLRAMGHYSE